MKKTLLLSILFIFSIFSYSQELDEAYLASLPENIREDVLQKMSDRDAQDTPVYRRPSSMINKDAPDSRRFGSKFFDMMQSSFMPVNEPNFDSSYILDFGDTLEIQLIGQKNSVEVLPVKRDGSINISEIGKIFVSGLSLETSTTIIKNKISNAFIGIEAFVSLVNIRDIQVLVTGNAYNPGIYTLNGNSNLLHALTMAGGIDEQGSYRSIELIRDNKIISSVDLYDVFIHGKYAFNQRLRSGDSILVKPSYDLIELSGAFKRPGLYELLPNETFRDLYNFGNGFSPSANLNTLRISRLDKEDTQFIYVPSLDNLNTLKPIFGDQLNVRSYERKRITISGAIKTPGTYTLSKGQTLSSLIEKAEGYNDDAYSFGGILINKKALMLNEEAVEKLYTSFIQKLITKGDALFASESLPFILDELKKAPTSGRIIAEFDIDVLQARPELDTTLEDGDQIIIPSITQQVYIFGEVSNTGAIRYKPSTNLDEYILNTGGLLDTADYNNIYIVHPNGEVNRSVNLKLSFLKNKNDILIYPGSVIYVPRKVSSKDPALVAAIWAPIVSAMATSITALSVLDNNK